MSWNCSRASYSDEKRVDMGLHRTFMMLGVHDNKQVKILNSTQGQILKLGMGIESILGVRGGNTLGEIFKEEFFEKTVFDLTPIVQ